MARELFARSQNPRKIGNHPSATAAGLLRKTGNNFTWFRNISAGLTLQWKSKVLAHLAKQGKQFLSEFLPLLQQIHDQKLFTDIKPANLIRRSEDRKLVLIDFGAVKDEVTRQ